MKFLKFIFNVLCKVDEELFMDKCGKIVGQMPILLYLINYAHIDFIKIHILKYYFLPRPIWHTRHVIHDLIHDNHLLSSIQFS